MVRIAADTTTYKRTGRIHYSVRIAISNDEIKRLGDVKPTPVMSLEVFVEIGERTTLIKPLHDQLLRPFREK